ncbi:MAG: hypothetical protein ACRCYY_01220 [Trueperaceae bacterium]
MSTQLTLYRCYWPQAFYCLKDWQVSNFRTEAFGLLMTLDVPEVIARNLSRSLPFGAIVETIDLDSYQELDNEAIDEMLMMQSTKVTLESEKN